MTICELLVTLPHEILWRYHPSTSPEAYLEAYPHRIPLIKLFDDSFLGDPSYQRHVQLRERDRAPFANYPSILFAPDPEIVIEFIGKGVSSAARSLGQLLSANKIPYDPLSFVLLNGVCDISLPEEYAKRKDHLIELLLSIPGAERRDYAALVTEILKTSAHLPLLLRD